MVAPDTSHGTALSVDEGRPKSHEGGGLVQRGASSRARSRNLVCRRCKQTGRLRSPRSNHRRRIRDRMSLEGPYRGAWPTCLGSHWILQRRMRHWGRPQPARSSSMGHRLQPDRHRISCVDCVFGIPLRSLRGKPRGRSDPNRVGESSS